MCGLFGILFNGDRGRPSADRLAETARALAHRGPDGHGIHGGDGVGLVHTRLSLVDLDARSNQPFWDPSGRYALVYNGELYGYDALRTDLETRGVEFRTTSDTEVLLHALIRLGVEETLRRIEGMFAFALFDRVEGSLVLARDRLGIKPLYVAETADAFMFASTVGALAPWIALRPNMAMVGAYLGGFNGPMSGASFYEGVEIVPPGSVIRVRRGEAARRSPYFRLTDLVDPALADRLEMRSEDDVVDEVESLLMASVKRQLVADAAVGAFCSGGVDSSLIMAMAARTHGNLQVFHADVEGRLSERTAAEALARHLKLDLVSVAVRDQHFVERLPEITDRFELPMFMHPTSVPVMLVSELVRANGVKAVLSGEGSDECYLGYPWLVPDIRGAATRWPRRLAGRLGALIGAGRSSASSSGDGALARGLVGRFEVDLGPEVYDGEAGGEAMRPVSRDKTSLAGAGELSYILRTLLHRNDTMGMAASVESRFPFLDTGLIRLATNLPRRYKVRFDRTVRDRDHLFYRDKWIVRRIADRYVPAELSRRVKLPFPTDAFARTRIDDAFFSRSFVREAYGLSDRRLAHLMADASPTLRLRLLHLEVWAERCLTGRATSDLASRLGRHVQIVPAG